MEIFNCGRKVQNPDLPEDYEFVQDFPVLHVGHHISPSRETLVDFIKYHKSESKFSACSYHTYL